VTEESALADAEESAAAITEEIIEFARTSPLNRIPAKILRNRQE